MNIDGRITRRKLPDFRLGPTPTVTADPSNLVPVKGDRQPVLPSKKFSLHRFRGLAAPIMALAATAVGLPKSLIALIPMIDHGFFSSTSPEAANALDLVHLAVTALNILVVPALSFVAYRWRRTLELTWEAIKMYGIAKTLASEGGRSVTPTEMEAILDKIEDIVGSLFKSKEAS